MIGIAIVSNSFDFLNKLTNTLLQSHHQLQNKNIQINFYIFS